jgi:hypothetical protein
VRVWAGFIRFNGSFYEDSNDELSGSTKAEDLLIQLSNYKCLKEHTALSGYLNEIAELYSLGYNAI